MAWRTRARGALIVGLLAIGLALGVRGLGSESAYSPAAIQAHVLQQPRAWLGRVVLVRGSVISLAYASYKYGHFGLEQSGTAQVGCFVQLFRSLPACLRTIAVTLHLAPPAGSIVHLTLAEQPYLFLFDGRGGLLQQPPGTLLVRYRTPVAPRATVPSSLPRWLSSVLAWSHLLPQQTQVPVSGIYRIRLIGVPTHAQPWQDNAVLLSSQS